MLNPMRRNYPNEKTGMAVFYQIKTTFMKVIINIRDEYSFCYGYHYPKIWQKKFK